MPPYHDAPEDWRGLAETVRGRPPGNARVAGAERPGSRGCLLSRPVVGHDHQPATGLIPTGAGWLGQSEEHRGAPATQEKIANLPRPNVSHHEREFSFIH